jgi:hypothetical protein
MKVKFMQEGGEVVEQPMPQEGAPVEEGAPAEGAAPAPEEQLQGLAQDIIGQIGPEAATALGNMLIDMAAAGAQAPAGEQPVFARRGTKIRRMR